MTDRRPLGLPFTPDATEDDRPAAARRLPVERGALFLPLPSPEPGVPQSTGRRPLALGGLTFSDQPASSGSHP